MPSDAYTRYGCRIWDRLEQHTGRVPFYVDAQRIASYCPSCGDGTMLVRFVEHPRPGMAVSSQCFGGGRCSHGCTEQQINEALA